MYHQMSKEEMDKFLTEMGRMITLKCLDIAHPGDMFAVHYEICVLQIAQVFAFMDKIGLSGEARQEVLEEMVTLALITLDNVKKNTTFFQSSQED